MSQFIGLPLFVYGQNPNYVNPSTGTASPHFGTNNITEIGLASFDGPVPTNEATEVFGYDFNPAQNGEIHVIGGDSGSPSVANIGGQLGLAGSHYGIDTTTNESFDTYLPFYINQLNTAMAPTGFQLTVIGVPEPSSIVLVGLAAGFIVRRRFSKRAKA